MSANRRRFLALAALALPAARAFAEDGRSPIIPDDPGELVIQNFGSWLVRSQFNQSVAFIPSERARTSSASVDTVGGSAKIELEYWSVGKYIHTGKLQTSNHGGIMSATTRVYVDGGQVDSFSTNQVEERDLAQYFGPGLEGLKTATDFRVTMDIGDQEVTVYDVDLNQTGEAMAAMRTIPDYNYNVRRLGWVDPSASSDPQQSCFLTSACCDAVGLAGDCSELTILRRFRDEVMMATPEGRADVARYYRLAPAILAEIARRGDRRALRRLYFTDILPSVFAARLGLNRFARRRYTAMMTRLSERHLGGAA